jgi:hypothetical protein
MKSLSKLLLILLLCLLTTATAPLAYGVFKSPGGVIQWDKQKTAEGYIHFSVGKKHFIINMAGRIIKEWEIPGRTIFLENGHLLSQIAGPEENTITFIEKNWDGETVWQYDEVRPGYEPHHSFKYIHDQALDQETLLFIANKEITPEQALAAGADPANKLPNDISLDAIVEVDMTGKVVWEWWFFDHLIQDIDPAKQNYVGAGKTIADYPNKLNINLPGKPLKRDWLHVNSVDYNPKLGQIVINSAHGEFYVVDHDNTFVAGDPEESIRLAASGKGDFLYRFGDPARYDQGEKPATLEDWNLFSLGHKQLGPSHDVSWIPEGYSGGGNFLVFNNGNNLYQPLMSPTILEINPYLKQNLAPAEEYVNPPDAGYKVIASKVGKGRGVDKQISNQVVWSFTPTNHQSFVSSAGSHALRLKNGNTFACANQEGHFIEIDREGNIVWEYVSPMISENEAVASTDSQSGKSIPAKCSGKYSADFLGLDKVNTKPGPTLLEKYGSPTKNLINTPLRSILLVCVGFLLGYSIWRKK